MEQDRPNTSGFGTASGSDFGSPTGNSSTTGGMNNTGVTTCAHCGNAINQDRGLEQFLGRIGISEEMINNLRSSMQNVDVEEYLNTARDYLKTASDKIKGSSDKAGTYAKENPGKVAAGVAVLAVGAGLLLSSLGRDK
jgi:hypothetical protein